MSYPFSYMHLSNVELIEQIYANYQQDPESVDPSWKYFFEGASFASAGKSGQEDLTSYLVIEAYRRFGHLKAKSNPLFQENQVPSALQFNFKEQQLNALVTSYGVLAEEKVSLKVLIERLEALYCGSVGFEYIHCNQPVITWLQERIEQEEKPLSTEVKKRIFRYLNQAELMEKYLHTKYVGQKRFSLEGAETVIPVLAEIVETGGEQGIEEIVLGMPHRGRMNVLANILGKSYEMIFSEFEDFHDAEDGDGDVKYHKGYSSNIVTEGGRSLHVGLTPNPSHLESVVPVVQGRVYAKQKLIGDDEKKRVVPVVLHGDASLPGQGVVYETMQLSHLKGYSTGGTLHVVIDNQVGFTATPEEYRSTYQSTDIAHTFNAPVFHLNAEDPEACVQVAQLAVELRQLFQCDVFLHLLCYRKYGHNEADEPAFTQPMLYTDIRQRSSIRDLYHTHLLKEGVIAKEKIEEMEREFKQHLDAALQDTKEKNAPFKEKPFEGVWEPFHKISQQELFSPLETGVPEHQLRQIARHFSTIPEGFAMHPKLKRLVEERLKNLDGSIDWALAEHLAFGSLLEEGIPIRLSGQDSARGTFTQRHAVWVDQNTNEFYFPLCHLSAHQGHFAVYNSPLSEFGVLAFEYGYSLSAPQTLVLWEAQFGDFANGAQVIIDQYIAACEQKWQRYSGLVMLLPHGYEGQGAEHSSARIERYLQLCAQNNLQVCYPTTPAQYFHLLRRQVKRAIRLPLIVMTPKGLLRHSLCVSSLDQLAQGSFQEVLFEDVPSAYEVICCTGRIYYDLVEEREKRGHQAIAIVRFEQLYPLKQEIFTEITERYPEAKELTWVQEEPVNMGAARFMTPLLQQGWKSPLRVVARAASAATATGSHKRHVKEYNALMNRIFKDEKAH